MDEDGDPHPLHTDPNYALTAAQARLYQQRGYGLDKDPQTAGEMYSAAGDLAIASNFLNGNRNSSFYLTKNENTLSYNLKHLCQCFILQSK